MKINLVDSIGVNCSSIDDGREFFNLVYPELKEKKSVEVDFTGVKSILTPFLLFRFELIDELAPDPFRRFCIH